MKLQQQQKIECQSSKVWFCVQVKQIEDRNRNVVVAAHLRGMWPTPSTKKDTLMLRGKPKLYY